MSGPLLVALAWSATLVADPTPFGASGAFLVGLGLLINATVSVVGLVVTRGRWAHRLGIATAVAGLVTAVSRPIDAWWYVALTITALTLVILMSASLRSTVRQLPSATGPPSRAVLSPLALLAVPLLLGLVARGDTSWAATVVALSAPVVAVWYTRVIPGGLWAIRLIWPVVALGLAPLMSLEHAVTTVVMAGVVLYLTWDQSVKTAYHPPVEAGSTFPIPPELAPGEVLDAANIDDRGRPR